MIDCDVHNNWTTAEVLLPYLEKNFRDYMERGELPGPRGALPHAHRPWFHPEGFRRQDIAPQTEDDHYQLMKERLLDRYAIDVAILTGDDIIDLSSIANPFYASALARAHNDWMIDQWLPRDQRFKGSIVVPSQSPVDAAAEIRRVGEHPDMVQILLSSGATRPYGDPFFHPIWEAAAEVNLPVAIHLGSEGGINNAQMIAAGPSMFYWETHALFCEVAMTHVASTIAQGIFEKWPNMYFIVIECGIAWLPALLWRLDGNYQALRKETPWLKRLPSEYARDHIRMTTQPLEAPKNRQHLWNVLEAMDGQHTLMFASDYPHWDFDDPTKLRLPPAWQENIFDTNARQVYARLATRQPEGASTQSQQIAAEG